MERNTFTYEVYRFEAAGDSSAEGGDHHNCLTLKYETDLLLAENYINRIILIFGTEIYG